MTASKKSVLPNSPFGGLNLVFNSDKKNAPPAEDEPLRTLIVGNLGDRIGEELLYELFLQAGPLDGVRMPRDAQSNRPHGMAFVVFRHTVSVDFAMRLMTGIRLYGRELQLTKMSASGQPQPPMQSPMQPTGTVHHPPPPPPPPPLLGHTPPSRGQCDRGFQNGRSPFLHPHNPPVPRPLMMAPPPPLFAMNKAPSFGNHTPMPLFRPPLFTSHSDPGYNNVPDYRRPPINHSGYTDRNRHGGPGGGQYHGPHKDETPRRHMPYSRPNNHSRGNEWR